MKHHICKKLCLLLLIALALPLAVACNGTGPQPTTPTEGGTAGETLPPAEGLSASALADYLIIYPEDGLAAAPYNALKELQTLLSERFGKELELRDDFVMEGTKFTERPQELLIGNTNRTESLAVYAELTRADDYEIRIVGEKLVVASLSDEGLAAALQALVASIPQSGSDVFFRKDAQVSYKGSYAVQQLTLNQAEISEYTVVYGKGGAKTLAEGLISEIRRKTGYLLPLVAAAKAPAGQKLILVGDTGHALPDDLTDKTSLDQFYAGAAGGNIYLWGADTAALVRAVGYFNDRLRAIQADTAALDITSGVIGSPADTMTAMTFNLYVSDFSTARAERVCNVIRTQLPDTFGVQEANGKWMAALSLALGDTYAYVGVSRDNNTTGEYSAVFYRKDKFTVVESGTKWLTDTPDKVSQINGSKETYPRIFTYAVLERTADGARFVHINTHLHHTKADEDVRTQQATYLMQFVAKYKHLPVILTGDFNTTSGTTTYDKITSDFMSNSAGLALTQGSAQTAGGKTIDFIFVSGGSITVYDYWVEPTETEGESYVSDHRPVLIRYSLSNS